MLFSVCPSRMRCAHGQQVYGRLWRWSFSLRMMSSRNRMGWSLRIWMGKPFNQEKRLRWMKVAWRSPIKASLSLSRQLGSAWHGCICKRQRWPQTIFKAEQRGFRNFILLQHAWASLSRGATVFCLGALLGIPLGFRIGLIAGLIRLLSLWDLCHPWPWSPWWSWSRSQFQLTDTATVGIILIGFLIDIGNRQLKSWLVSWKCKA
jgi:hypothetical protein